MKQLIIFSFIMLLALIFGCNVEVDDSDQSATGTAGELTIDPEADKLLKQMSDNLSSTNEFTVQVQSSSDFTKVINSLIYSLLKSNLMPAAS